MKRITPCIFLTLASALLSAADRPQVKATPCGAASHCSVLTWTEGSTVTGGAFQVYRSTTSGGEGTTPIATGIAGTTYTDTSVVANTKYFYTVAYCATSLSAGSLVCSVPSNEASDIIPLAPSDLSAPGSLVGSAN